MDATKLDVPLKYRHLAKVTIRRFADFPLDMLRKDHCFPNSERDSGLIEQTFHHTNRTTVVILKSYSDSKNPPWTVGRWESFGAQIEPITDSEAGAIYRQMDEAFATPAAG